MDLTISEPLSEPMRRVLDALFSGQPVPPDAQAALSEEERAQVAALARTAHLTRAALNRPDPSPDVEAAALARAQDALSAQSPRGSGAPVGETKPRPSWLARLFGKKQDS